MRKAKKINYELEIIKLKKKMKKDNSVELLSKLKELEENLRKEIRWNSMTIAEKIQSIL